MKWLLPALVSLVGCSAPPRPSPAPRAAEPRSYVAVLVGGDDSLPVFDNATRRMERLLDAAGTPPWSIERLGAGAKAGAQSTLANVLQAVGRMEPRAGQACLVFMTSHGAHGPGLYLAPREEFLSPAMLDGALDRGCGLAPTVAIVSACYTGNFAEPPMTRPNRIVLTAARADRPSFGCGAGRDYTVFDSCLLGVLERPPATWSVAMAETQACVSREEARERERPSMPQLFIGAAAANLPVP